LVNKAIVAQLQSMNIPAIGLTGADANLMLAQKRAVKEVDYGFVGDLTEEGINLQFLSVLLDQQLIPVVAPLTHDGKGQMLNTNADTIAREIAVSMSGRYQVQLIYCFDKHGVLRDPEDEDSVIPQINLEDYERYKAEGVVKAGMIPKLDNAFNAIKHGVGMVRMGQASQLTNLVGGKAGTLIYSS
jgi:acetylglutamate kinase